MPICKEVVLTIWKQMFIPSPLYCGRSYPGRHPMCSQGEGTISSIMLVSWTALLTNMVLFMLTQTDPIICCSFYVVKEHGRPDIDPCWPDDIQSMLESSFDVDIGMRPVSSWFTIYDMVSTAQYFPRLQYMHLSLFLPHTQNRKWKQKRLYKCNWLILLCLAFASLLYARYSR